MYENELLSHLLIDHEYRDYLWDNKLYQLLPQCMFYNYGVAKGSNGHDYILISVNPVSGENQIPYSLANRYALDHIFGIGLLTNGAESSIPSKTIPFGCVWSFHEFGDFRGPHQHIYNYNIALEKNPRNPFSVEKNDFHDEIIIGEPSFEILPAYVREIISNEIKGRFSTENVTYKWYQQEKYILCDRVLIQHDLDLSEKESYDLGEYLSWYMPFLLPVIIGN